MIDRKNLFLYLRWILGDKEKQKEHAVWLERILKLSDTAEIFDGMACGQAIDKLVEMLDKQIMS